VQLLLDESPDKLCKGKWKLHGLQREEQDKMRKYMKCFEHAVNSEILGNGSKEIKNVAPPLSYSYVRDNTSPAGTFDRRA
ncbi:MAG: hypothetical protein E6496_00335, partial [Lachnoanaerobaculum sp.]|nr:hypothetical protein [Lachnoanaerobaculum sp.]